MFRKYSWSLAIVGLVLVFNANADKYPRWLYDHTRAVEILDRRVEERGFDWVNDYKRWIMGYLEHDEFINQYNDDLLVRNIIPLRRLITREDDFKNLDLHWILKVRHERLSSLAGGLYLKYGNVDDVWREDLLTVITLAKRQYWDFPTPPKKKIKEIVTRYSPGLNITALSLFSNGQWDMEASVETQIKKPSPESIRLNLLMTSAVENSDLKEKLRSNNIGELDQWMGEETCNLVAEYLNNFSEHYVRNISSLESILYSIVLFNRDLKFVKKYCEYFHGSYFTPQECLDIEAKIDQSYGFKAVDQWYEFLVEKSILSAADAAFFRHFVYELTRNPLPYGPDDPQEPLLHLQSVKEEL